MPHMALDVTGYRDRVARSVVVIDFRRYQKHRGQFLCADRVKLVGRWTPMVRVRLRSPRAADGATEI